MATPIQKHVAAITWLAANASEQVLLIEPHTHTRCHPPYSTTLSTTAAPHVTKTKSARPSPLMTIRWNTCNAAKVQVTATANAIRAFLAHCSAQQETFHAVVLTRFDLRFKVGNGESSLQGWFGREKARCQGDNSSLSRR